MKSPEKRCANCNFDYDKGFRFCPNCGQKSEDTLTVKVLFYNTLSNYFSYDARFLKSVVPLHFKPGYVAKEFVLGRRLKYLHPAQYYLFASVLFFFLFSFTVRNLDNEVNDQIKQSFEEVKNNPLDKLSSKDSLSSSVIFSPSAVSSTPSTNNTSGLEDDHEEEPIDIDFGINMKRLDSLIEVNAPIEDQLASLGMNKNSSGLEKRFFTQYVKVHKNRGGGLVQSFFDTIPIALFFYLPIFSVILYFIFWKKVSFTHNLVFSFYFFSFLFLVFTINTLINQFVLSKETSFFWVAFQWIVLYLFLAAKYFYAETYWRSLYKSLLVFAINFLLILPLLLS